VVHVGVVVADDLESIQDIDQQPVSFRDHVLSGRNIFSQTTWTDDGTNEVAFVVPGTFTNCLVHMDVTILCEHWRDVELGETAKLKLEG